jgi:hypothetical protein
MSNFSTALTVSNEIVKAIDFTFAHDQTINNIAVGLQAVLSKGAGDYIIGGKVTPYQSGGMNIKIEPIYGHCAGSGIDFVDTLGKDPVSIEDADSSFGRIDTVQVRGFPEEYDFQDRKFRDPGSGIETTVNTATKKRIILDVSIKKGSNGSVTAPPADVGYIKLAEIVIPSGTVSIDADNIKNITARSAGDENGGWTIDKTRTFNPGYLTDLITALLREHSEDGTHKHGVIKAENLFLSNGAGGVKGSIIPTGEPVNIRGVDFNALVSVTGVVSALAEAVNMAYTHANKLFGQYALLSDTPAAASTADVDIVAGGERVIDGVACTVGQMVFLKDQIDPQKNGFWEVQTGQWNRFPGYTAAAPAAFTGKFILVKTGTENTGKMFYLDDDSSKIDKSPLNFRETMFSPMKAPGKVVLRDLDGKTEFDKKLEDVSANMMDGTEWLIRHQQGVATLSNKGVISGCGVVKSATASRNLSVEPGFIFAKGQMFPFNGEENGAVVPSNNDAVAAACYAYLRFLADGKIDFAVTEPGGQVPPGGVPLYLVTIPAGNGAANDPNLANVTLTSVRRIEANFPVYFSTALYVNVSLPFPMTDADYAVALDVISMEGSDLQRGRVYPGDRNVNGFKIYYNGVGDNLQIRWQISKT